MVPPNRMDEVPVDSGGYCFICLIKLEEPRAESSGSGWDPEEESPPPVYPEQCLSLTRYLEADIWKVLDRHGKGLLSLSSHELAAADLWRCQLKVTLCGECVTVNQQFLELFLQLRKIETEVTSCLGVIYDRMSTDEGVDREEAAVLALANGIRKEVMEKCSIKLSYMRTRHNVLNSGTNCEKPPKRSQEDHMSDNSSSESECPQGSSDNDEGHLGAPDMKIEVGSDPEDEYDPSGANDDDNGSTTSEMSKPGSESESSSSEYMLSDTSSGEDEADSDNGPGDDSNLEDDSTAKDTTNEEDSPGKRKNHRGPPSARTHVKYPLIVKCPAELAKKVGKPRSTFNKRTSKYSCALCPAEYRTVQGVGGHWRATHLQIRYGCTQCGKDFGTKTNFRDHCGSAHNIGPQFHCDLCHKSYPRQLLLTDHRKKSHPTGEPRRIPKPDRDPETGRLKCSRCPKTFKRGPQFTEHFRSSHLHLKFGCAHCDKQFARKQNLKIHELSAHQGIGFPCPGCRRSFTSKACLNMHLRKTPCGEGMGLKPPPQKDNVCHLCGKGFLSVSQLHIHNDSVHLKLRTHLCDLCGQKFKTGWSGLSQHRKIHEEAPKKPSKPEGEHRCTICGKGYATPTTLRKHMKEMHLEVRTYTCQICLKELAHERSLKAHMKACHKDAEAK